MVLGISLFGSLCVYLLSCPLLLPLLISARRSYTLHLVLNPHQIATEAIRHVLISMLCRSVNTEFHMNYKSAHEGRLIALVSLYTRFA